MTLAVCTVIQPDPDDDANGISTNLPPWPMSWSLVEDAILELISGSLSCVVSVFHLVSTSLAHTRFTFLDC